MHPWRKHILFRWLFAAAVIVGLGGYLGYYAWENQPKLHYTSAPELKPLQLPKSGEIAELNQALDELERVALETPRLAQSPDPAFFDVKSAEVAETEKVQPQLALVFLGESSRFASLDGRLYTTGQKTDQGAVIQKIERDAVRLVSDSRSETIYWIDPMRVSLTRPQPASAGRDSDSEAGVRNMEQGQVRGGETSSDSQIQEAMPQTIREAALEKSRETEQPQGTETEESP